MTIKIPSFIFYPAVFCFCYLGFIKDIFLFRIPVYGVFCLYVAISVFVTIIAIVIKSSLNKVEFKKVFYKDQNYKWYTPIMGYLFSIICAYMIYPFSHAFAYSFIGIFVYMSFFGMYIRSVINKYIQKQETV